MKAAITAGASIDGAFARMAGTNLKALAPIRGRSMLLRTVDALRGAGASRIAVVGNDEIRRACESEVERVVPDGGSGARNVLGALDAWPEDGEPLLYLTCDMPYVDAACLRAFVDRAPSGALAMPLAEHADFERRFPGAPPFGITLAGERVVNGGAFLIPPGAGANLRTFAARLFDARKAPWRMARIAGGALLLRFATGRLSIAQLEARAQALLGCEVAALRNCAPELGYDADVADEYRYALEHE